MDECTPLIPGYNTKNTISLRLWDAEPSVPDFDLVAGAYTHPLFSST